MQVWKDFVLVVTDIRDVYRGVWAFARRIGGFGILMMWMSHLMVLIPLISIISMLK